MSDDTPRPSQDLGTTASLPGPLTLTISRHLARPLVSEMKAQLTALPSLDVCPSTESSPLLTRTDGDEHDGSERAGGVKGFMAALTDPSRELTAGEKLLGAVAVIVSPIDRIDGHG